MKIVDMKVTPIAIADPPLRSAFGLHAPYATRTIIELISEDGISGFAEAHGGERMVNAFESVRSRVSGTDAFAQSRLWLDINDGIMSQLESQTGADPDSASPSRSRQGTPLRVFAAVEVAALDLIGKAIGKPVCELLGGRIRDEVEYSAYLFFKHPGGGGEDEDIREDQWGEVMDPSAMVSEAKRMTEQYGFRSLKFKGGVLSPDQEVQTVHELRAAFGPDAPIRIDPNTSWSVETSVKVAKALDGQIEYLEDPTYGIDGMSEVRKRLVNDGFDVPLATNMAVVSFPAISEAVRKDAVQIILGDHHFWGGIRAITQLGRLCETFEIGLSMHSNTHLGLSLLAMTHVAAATPHLTFACDTHYPWQHEKDEILVGGRIPIENGTVKVPDRPGLGAEVDYDALARGNEKYHRFKEYQNKDDVAEMRKHVSADWRVEVPRW